MPRNRVKDFASNNIQNVTSRFSESESETEPDCFPYCCTSIRQGSLNEDHEIFNYFRDASIHGLRYIGSPGRPILERLFWLAVVLASVVSAVYLVKAAVIDPMYDNPIIISFQADETTVDQIPFPAFTLCNANKIKRSPMEHIALNVTEYLDFLIEINSTTVPNGTYIPESEYITLQYLDRYCEGSKSFLNCFGYTDFGNIKHRLDDTDPAQALVQINEDSSDGYFEKEIWSRAKTSFHRCEDMLLLCLWQQDQYPCNELFTPIQTEFGYCCTFNMMPRFILKRMAQNDSRVTKQEREMADADVKAWSNWNVDSHLIYYEDEENDDELGSADIPKITEDHFGHFPKYSEQAGMSNGLSILVNPELSEYHCMAQNSEGFRAEVHSLIDFPHVADFGKAIKPDTETFMAVKAEVTISDMSLKNIPLHKRLCYFSGEHKLTSSKFHTQRNCVDECVANITYEKCGCVQYFMPRQSSQILCGPNLYPCAQEVKRNLTMIGFQNSCPKCDPACIQVQYHATATTLPLRKDIPLWKTFSTLNDAKWANESIGLIHVYFESDIVETKVRKTLYGLEKIISDAGGLLGLTLGISVISLIEPFYFFTLRCLCTYFRKKHDIKSFGNMKNVKSTGSNPVMKPKNKRSVVEQLNIQKIVVQGAPDALKFPHLYWKDLDGQSRF